MKLSREQIDAYLAKLASEDYSAGTLMSYKHKLELFYRFLPADKSVGTDTLEAWQDALLEGGYSARSVNVSTAAANGLMACCGRRDLCAGRVPEKENIQPELTRNEYLRLLAAAKLQGNRKRYLLAKVFGVTGLPVGGLEKLTAEAVREGQIPFPQYSLRIPGILRQELLAYIQGEGIASGPVFVNRTGKPMDRSSVNVQLQALCRDARVDREKATPRCLRKLCQSVRDGIRADFAVLVEQAYDRLLEKEQRRIGWEEPGCRSRAPAGRGPDAGNRESALLINWTEPYGDAGPWERKARNSPSGIP